MKTALRGGVYYRVANPDWVDPFDTSYSLAMGGRWNVKGEFGACYLSCDIPTAQANAWQMLQRKFRPMPYSLDDLRDHQRPVLYSTYVPSSRVLDAFSPVGLQAVGLPITYPFDTSGKTIGWSKCQSIGRIAYLKRMPALAARSAAPGAPGGSEELAWLLAGDHALRPSGPARSFDDWFGN